MVSLHHCWSGTEHQSPSDAKGVMLESIAQTLANALGRDIEGATVMGYGPKKAGDSKFDAGVVNFPAVQDKRTGKIDSYGPPEPHEKSKRMYFKPTPAKDGWDD